MWRSACSTVARVRMRCIRNTRSTPSSSTSSSSTTCTPTGGTRIPVTRSHPQVRNCDTTGCFAAHSQTKICLCLKFPPQFVFSPALPHPESEHSVLAGPHPETVSKNSVPVKLSFQGFFLGKKKRLTVNRTRVVFVSAVCGACVLYVVQCAT